jgi:hypothetical protein
VPWDWAAFGIGVLVGTVVMWVAAVVSAAREADNEEHFR